MHHLATIVHVVLAVAFAAWPLASQTQADSVPGNLAIPFNWPVIRNPDGAIQLYLRTRWEDGLLRYVVTLTDSKGRIARWFSKNPDNDRLPHSSFEVKFADEDNFHLYTLSLLDRAFYQVRDTGNWASKGESRCTKKIYRAALKAAIAKRTSEWHSHGLAGPPEVMAPSSPASRR